MPKIVKLVIGALLMAIGVVWFFQGIGSLAGSPMTGVGFWAFAGVIMFVVGLFLVVRGVKGNRSSLDG
jgi:divalent metal cation (Fe/Co/Zn/Cd) transporter